MEEEAESPPAITDDESVREPVDVRLEKSDDVEDFKDVPFNKHPRFRQVIQERKEFKQQAEEMIVRVRLAYFKPEITRVTWEKGGMFVIVDEVSIDRFILFCFSSLITSISYSIILFFFYVHFFTSSEFNQTASLSFNLFA